MSLYDGFDGYFERDYPFGIPGDVWKSKNGPIKVSDMSEHHIRSCMKIVGEDGADLVAAVLDREAGREHKRRQMYEQTDCSNCGKA